MVNFLSKSKKINQIKKIVREYVNNLKPFIKVERAVLFGSRARGEGKRDSDIDIIVISPDFKNMDFISRLVWLSRMRGEKFMSPGMDILGYTPEEFKKLSKESIVLAEAKREGVLIK